MGAAGAESLSHADERTDLSGTIEDLTPPAVAEIADRDAQELCATAFAQAPIGMALIGLDGRWIKVNHAVCEITGWTEAELLHRTFQDMSRGEIWVLLSVTLVRDAAGRPRHFISQIADISARKRAERRLREAEAEARAQRDHATAIISAMHEGYALTIDTEIKAVNHALCALTGFTESELVGRTPPYPFWPPELSSVSQEVRRRVLERGGGTFELTLMRANGERFEAEVTAQPARDGAGGTIGFVNTLRDVSVQRRQQRELERLARTDSLTGLANRHVLQESLEREAGRQGLGQLALVLLDLDLFKQVNDDFGHPAGDAVLVEVARRLLRTVHPGEVLARVGGEEFAWLLPASSVSEAVAAADRARAAISAHSFRGAGMLTMSAGVGLSATPSDGYALYRIADRALYEAKQRGRNRTCCQTIGIEGPGVPAPGSLRRWAAITT